MANVKCKPERCPNCHKHFTKRRSDTRFCSPKCRKNLSQKTARKLHPINSKFSPTKSRENYELLGSAAYLAELYYNTPPAQRMDFIKSVVDCARSGNSRLRSLLTNRRILYPEDGLSSMFYRECPQCYRTIAQIAGSYCKLLWGAGVKAVVYCEVAEPPTGEVFCPKSVVTIRSRGVTKDLKTKAITKESIPFSKELECT